MSGTGTLPLRFDVDQHRYFLGDRELLAVTRVLTLEGFIDPTWYTEFGRQRGTYVHQMLEWLDAGELDEEHLDPALRPYLEAYRAFCAAVRPTWAGREQRLADPALGVAGTVDAVGTIADAPAIVDFKTGGCERWHELQTALYALLAEANGVIPSARRVKRYGLYLTKDGAYDFRPHSNVGDLPLVRAIAQVAVYKVTHGYAIY